jgi:hypothetical protein
MYIDKKRSLSVEIDLINFERHHSNLKIPPKERDIS